MMTSTVMTDDVNDAPNQDTADLEGICTNHQLSLYRVIRELKHNPNYTGVHV